MDEARHRDFTTTLGEAFCGVIWQNCHIEASPQDGYEVFVRMLGADAITSARVHAMQVSKAELTQLRDTARIWMETEQISLEDIQEVVRVALWRWPPDAT